MLRIIRHCQAGTNLYQQLRRWQKTASLPVSHPKIDRHGWWKCKQIAWSNLCDRHGWWKCKQIVWNSHCLPCRQSFRSSTIAPALSYYRPSMDICSRPLL